MKRLLRWWRDFRDAQSDVAALSQIMQRSNGLSATELYVEVAVADADDRERLFDLLEKHAP